MLKIITDSASDITLAQAKELNVDMISLNVTFEGKTYKEEKDISKEEFFDLLVNSPSFPITSQPAPSELMEILEEAKKNNDEVIGIFLSSKISGTYDNAVMIKNMVEIDNCHFIDSLSCSCGERYLVNEACRMRDEGINFNDIVSTLEELKTRVRVMASADNLDYLAKGGRVNAVAHKVGNLLKFKPLVTLDLEGKVSLFSKPRGTKSAIEELVLKLVNERLDERFPICALYTPSIGNMLKLVEKLANVGVEIHEFNKHMIGAVIGSHLGPNSFGLAYVVKENK